MKYCKTCNQNVMPTKKFSITWFIIDCLTIVGGGIYILYFLFFKKKVCPICNCNQLEDKHDNIITCKNGSSIDQACIKSEQQKIRAHEASERATALSKEADAKLAIAKARTAETIRKRKAGELPWQIKKEQKRISKLNKNI